ncbi:MAG TPA: hypothetical protein VH600_01065 [Burkholderiales bacterium]|jgi:hypothetical protein
MMRALLLCLALLASIRAASAQELGRLFFTEEQRAALDARRRARIPDRPTAPAAVTSPTTRVDGYVRRSGGPSTVWVNGESQGVEGSEAPHIESGRREGRVSVPVGDGAVRFSLKPGQVVDRGTGEIRDVLGPNGEIDVKPTK